MERIKAVQQQLNTKTMELQQLSTQVPVASSPYALFQKELDDLKARVARTEQEHQTIKSKVMVD